MADTQESLGEILRAYDARVSHARAMHRMAVTAADSRLQHELDHAAEIKAAELNDLAHGAYMRSMFSVGVTRLADLPASERRTRIEG